MTTVIVKNNTVSNQWLSDFGIALVASGQIALNEVARLSKIYSSNDLKTKVTNDIFIINNGTSDLSKADALLYLDFTTDYELESAALSGADLTYLEEGIETNTINIAALSAVDHTDYVTKREIAMMIALGGF